MPCYSSWWAPLERRLTTAYNQAFTALVSAAEDNIKQEIMSAVTPPSQKPSDEYVGSARQSRLPPHEF